ncbi:hypothetical protein D210916BOD24_07200 [Alteromonas sp. D210916BOD_24]|uniref:cupredoxin domain-containing protein n=1 Tax=Alteromonas sp. D210916BOD_24 TaxID=3157618 RepID=UPI00399CD044
MLVINVMGLALIVFIVWWFWLYTPKAIVSSDNDVLITVNNGVYSPSTISVSVNKPITLRFIRTDASPCAEMLLIPELAISAQLPLNEETDIKLPALLRGEYAFHCQMNMYKGMIKVV